jgi:hypothetical protein
MHNIHAYIQIHHTQTYIHIYVYVRKCVFLSAYKYICMCVFMSAYNYVFVNLYIHPYYITYTTYAFFHVHAYAYTCLQRLSVGP